MSKTCASCTHFRPYKPTADEDEDIMGECDAPLPVVDRRSHRESVGHYEFRQECPVWYPASKQAERAMLIARFAMISKKETAP
jgi:hypothetical protein